jgi:hypothetical protein
VSAEIDRKASSGSALIGGAGGVAVMGAGRESPIAATDDDSDRSDEGGSGCDRPPGKHRQVQDRDEGTGQSRGGNFAQYDSLLRGSLGDETPSRGCRPRCERCGQ